MSNPLKLSDLQALSQSSIYIYTPCILSKASYTIDLPHVGDAAKASHLLPDDIIKRSTAVRHRPLNPHKQRLLAAAEKKAQGDPETSRSAYSQSKREFLHKLL